MSEVLFFPYQRNKTDDGAFRNKYFNAPLDTMLDEMTQDQDSSRANAEIDANLRRAYDEVTQQGIPERFKELLEKLRSGEGGLPSNENETPQNSDKSEGENGNG
ncbi:MAG: NepR family anti-sigma factor [Pseudomonadota bacterium]